MLRRAGRRAAAQRPAAAAALRPPRAAARGVVTVADARAMPRQWKDMPGDIILSVALTGEQGSSRCQNAQRERLVREIMAVDGIPWEQADVTVTQISAQLTAVTRFLRWPYWVSICAAGGAAAISFPMTFDRGTVLWFNHKYVTMEVPEPDDISSWLEIGNFAWNWAEPVMGQLSFVILCSQLMRNQLQNLGVKPVTGSIEEIRAKSIAKKYPKYDRLILRDFAVGHDWA